jgi:micrococcal nuclease
MKLSWRRLLLVGLSVVWPLSLAVAAAPAPVIENGVVARVIDGDTLVLTDGRHVRLDAINALEIPHRPDDQDRCLPSTRRTEPRFSQTFGCDLTLAQAARALLQTLTLGKPVRLQINPQRRDDRYGRMLAQLYVADSNGGSAPEVMVTAALVQAGLAHVYPLSGQELEVAPLLALEAAARQAKRGIWALPELQVTPAEQAATQYGHYTLIAGRVLNVSQQKTRILLNFGADFHTDFTVLIDKRDWSRFQSVDLMGLAGKAVQVRGFLYEDYGPAMRLNNPAQLHLEQ